MSDDEHDTPHGVCIECYLWGWDEGAINAPYCYDGRGSTTHCMESFNRGWTNAREHFKA